jgi:hypothetical protein
MSDCLEYVIVRKEALTKETQEIRTPKMNSAHVPNLCHIVGARPNFMKAAPLIAALRR